ncbi:hypothetical protein CB1_000698011 [Camelus ferus]|nr:hypothetical protein CB1_000698011 [Camelus ferus]
MQPLLQMDHNVTQGTYVATSHGAEPLALRTSLATRQKIRVPSNHLQLSSIRGSADQGGSINPVPIRYLSEGVSFEKLIVNSSNHKSFLSQNNGTANKMNGALDHSDQPDPDAIKMFVGQIPRSWSEKELKELFEPYGAVYQINVLRDRSQNPPQSKAFDDTCPSLAKKTFLSVKATQFVTQVPEEHADSYLMEPRPVDTKEQLIALTLMGGLRICFCLHGGLLRNKSVVQYGLCIAWGGAWGGVGAEQRVDVEWTLEKKSPTHGLNRHFGGKGGTW